MNRHNLRFRSIFLMVLLALSGGTSVVQAQTRYTVTDLGVLGSYENRTESSGFAINNSGQAVGYSTTSNSWAHALLWQSGTISDLGTLIGGRYSYAYDINDLGQVVGMGTSSDSEHAILWHAGGAVTDLNATIPADSGLILTRASAINNLGQVLCRGVRLSPFAVNGYVWQDGSLTQIGTFEWPELTDINDAGQVVGSANNFGGFLWQNGSVTALGGLGSGLYGCTPFAINAVGQIVGISFNDATYNAFLWTPAAPNGTSGGTMTDLGVLGTYTYEEYDWYSGMYHTVEENRSTALGINASGVVVGQSTTAQGYRAFVWQNGTMSDLNEQIPSDSGWVLITAKAISDDGSIVGTGFVNGQARAFVLTPLPNHVPVAVADAFTSDEDTVLSGTSVLTNDTDEDGDALSANLIAQPGNARSFSLSSDGTFIYEPNPNFNGTDSFTYQVKDGKGGVATGNVTITVTPINDAPAAAPDTAAAISGIPVVVVVLTNDADIDHNPLQPTTATHMVTLSSLPTSGSAVVNPDGTITYSSKNNYSGTDSFSYTLTDSEGLSSTATVTVAVSKPNSPPRAQTDQAETTAGAPVEILVLSNDSDPDSDALSIVSVTQPGAGEGTVSFSADRLTYTPPAVRFRGRVTFTYSISDGRGGTDTGRVAVRVR